MVEFFTKVNCKTLRSEIRPFRSTCLNRMPKPKQNTSSRKHAMSEHDARHSREWSWIDGLIHASCGCLETKAVKKGNPLPVQSLDDVCSCYIVYLSQICKSTSCNFEGTYWRKTTWSKCRANIKTIYANVFSEMMFHQIPRNTNGTSCTDVVVREIPKLANSHWSHVTSVVKQAKACNLASELEQETTVFFLNFHETKEGPSKT